MRQGVILGGGVLVLVLAVAGSFVALRSSHARTGTRGPAPGPDQVARQYLQDWQDGDLAAMRRLVDRPPADFADRHRALSDALRVTSVRFAPGPLARHGDQATEDVAVTRKLSGVGDWTFHTTLRLGRRDGTWRVRWSPATLHPALAQGGTLRLTRLRSGPSGPVAADGRELPAGSSAEPYLARIAERFGGGDGAPGWAVEVVNPGRAPQRLKVFPGRAARRIRTTLDRRMQAAADRAVGSAPAALVAIRPSTGEVLAIADRLPGVTRAFLGLYPPGSTFKVVVAAALLHGGMAPGTPVDCPAVTVAAQRTIHNDGDFALGRVPFAEAFADSCNTTFADLGVSAGAARLANAAGAFGFGAHFDPGVPAYSGDFPTPGSGNELAEDSIGQGRVQASPLAMAVAAAAVADGTCRSPRLLPVRLIGRRSSVALPASMVSGLRTMMRDVTARGTAAHAGLPAGTAGKTGSAEYDASGRTHAWFIGYRGDLAFAVFVEHGGEGGRVAAPVAARFLTALNR